MIWNDLDSILKSRASFVVSSHLSLDGDSVGSQLAMQWYLESLGKRCCIFNQDPLPRKFAFLSGSDRISTSRPEGTFDVLVVLDCSNPVRMGWNGHDRIAPFCVNIDHHRDNTRFADFNYVDQGAAATAMLLYRFFESRGISYPKSVAEYLYTAIMTDTGGFRFSNTSADVLAICADLARRGANSSFLYQRVYDSHSQNAMLLWARIWPTLRFDLDGRVCSLSLPLALVEELGAVYSDTEGMADYTVLAEDVEVGMFIKYRPTEAHFSLRSRGGVDVGRIAQKIPGGGGHGCAAGCTIALPYDQAKARMLETIKSELG